MIISRVFMLDRIKHKQIYTREIIVTVFVNNNGNLTTTKYFVYCFKYHYITRQECFRQEWLFDISILILHRACENTLLLE